MCWVYIEYKKGERHEKKKLRRQKEIVVHTDPHMKGSAAKLGLHKGCWLPVVLFPDDQLLDDIWDFSLRTDDIIVCSFPKSGTTWLQEIVYLIMNDLDVQKAQSANIEARFPYIEYVYPGLKDLSKLKGQRLMKSHLPYHHLPHEVMEGKSKVLYIARNPKDVAVSYYHFAKMFRESSYTGTMENFSDSFLSGQVPYGPWVIHVQEFYEMAKLKRNVMFIMYEDLKEDPEKVIKQIAKFLGKDLTPEQVSGIAKYCTFENMKKNPAANYSWWDEYGLRNKDSTPFLRKGHVGDWKNHLSPRLSKEFDLHLQQWFSANGSLSFRELLPEKKDKE
ncbi:hypothetical protein CAPTEDRAFT_151859 [Capitella teleta]|uniref:Sulfotransferase domain-containing protein n=1 Tax=Capitella teleta TaxID=283909 RepID=R7UZ99_CAPTE|nr:hypothetical protein CAPTEDRAFT_151859 [Capitella teleta]|eukprot:ELU09282.1 hypothetical protein CAPTEDRAFT_151859 [Capitella teleta]